MRRCRVEDWRAGLGRSSCSLLTHPFVCECHSISTMLTFPIPATSNAAHGFPAYTLTCLLHIKGYGTYPLARSSGSELAALSTNSSLVTDGNSKFDLGDWGIGCHRR